MSILSSSPLCLPPKEGIPLASPTFSTLIAPLEAQLPYLTPLVSRSNRPLDFTFDHQVRALVYYHTEAFTSGQDLLQAAQEDPFVHALMVPDTGLGESTFYEANANRGSQQMCELVDRLSKKACKRLKMAHPELGKLVAIDGSLIEACLSMRWAEYSSSQRKAKAHLGFDLNYGIPRRMVLTDGKGAERPFVSTLLDEGDTGVLDRGYVDYRRFDEWIDEGKHFVARIRKNAQYEILKRLPIPANTNIFFFARVRLGDEAHRMSHPLFLIGFKSRRKVYWVVTDREELSAEQIAFIYSLRWEIETFFAWWKRHLDVYHLISRNRHGVLLQLLAGLVTYLLLVLYFHQQFGERPSIRRLREMRRQIRQEATIAYLPVYTIDIELLLLLFVMLVLGKSQAKS
jgi:Transposase DDE domain